ncbi:hypothetical protein SDC9_80566 [bioreactor metagenome]|uniref:Uncharacterized protein n=1 Tax=bioreactor metagenome TaxID=1076179 RepID=A0A644YZC8_9ZZZZ
MENGDPAANAGLEEVGNAVFPGQLQKLTAVFRHQLFIGGYNAFMSRERTPCEFPRHACASDGLDDHRNLRIVFNDGKILDEFIRKGTSREITHIQNVLEFHE